MAEPSAAEIQRLLNTSPAFRAIGAITDKGPYATVAIHRFLAYQQWMNSADPVAQQLKQLNLAAGSRESSFAYNIDGSGQVRRINVEGHPDAMKWAAVLGMGAAGAYIASPAFAASGAVPTAAATPAAASSAAPSYMGAMYAAPGSVAAASTPAAVAPAVAPGVASSLTGSEIAGGLLRYGVPVAGNLIGSKIQANAARDASEAELAYYREALAYQKERDTYDRTTEATRYGDTQARLRPYRESGASANDRMATLLGLPSPGTSGAAQVTPPAATSSGVPMSGTVLIRAPNGQQRRVPADQVAHYTQQGGTVVG